MEIVVCLDIRTMWKFRTGGMRLPRGTGMRAGGFLLGFTDVRPMDGTVPNVYLGLPDILRSIPRTLSWRPWGNVTQRAFVDELSATIDHEYAHLALGEELMRYSFKMTEDLAMAFEGAGRWARG